MIIEWSVNQRRDLDPDLIMSDLIKYRPTLCLLHINHASDDDDRDRDHHIITYDQKMIIEKAAKTGRN